VSLQLDLERVRANVRSATTTDLLDRATVYRSGMEPEALAVIEEELRRRRVTEADIALHAEQHRDVLLDPGGCALTCHRCRRPAVLVVWDWHRLWGVLPVFPRRFPLCADHVPED
jgi:hypothetical protein